MSAFSIAKNNTMKAAIAIPVLIILIAAACNRSPYPGYSESKSGFHYKLLKIGESEIKPAPGDYITADISYSTMEDSVFFHGRRKFQISEPEYKGAIDECFAMLAEGDKAKFIISADKFFNITLNSSLPSFIDSGSNMKIGVNMLEVQKQAEYQKEKEAFLKWIEDFGEYEQIVLRQYLEKNKIDVEPTNTGLVFIPIRTGEGEIVTEGDTITVHYEGKFLNGKFFDSTKKRAQPFEFVYGQEWQVIEGLEEAFGMMREGGKALVILPSDIAFGQEGSSTGIIPPFTSLIYEIELMDIR